MEQKYFSLKDAIIAMEIEKHKWLESEKVGRDIGFTTAAIDWLNKYSDTWHKYYREKSFPERAFIERREFRRFKLETYAKIVSGGSLCVGKVINLSFMGLLSLSSNSIRAGSKARVHLTFGNDEERALSCIVSVERVNYLADTKKYEIFLRFDENIWQSLFSLEFIGK